MIPLSNDLVRTLLNEIQSELSTTRAEITRAEMILKRSTTRLKDLEDTYNKLMKEIKGDS